MHKFDPEHARRLERPERHQLLKPLATLQRFGVRTGMTVADLGAGTGFFARSAAELVGTTGRVYAVDMAPDMLAFMKSAGIPPQVHPVLSEEYRVPLPAGIADVVFIAFTVHETPDVPRFLAEAARLTAPGGRIVILEWKKQQEELGPEMEERLAEEELLLQIAPLYPVLDRGALNGSVYFVLVRPEVRS